MIILKSRIILFLMTVISGISGFAFCDDYHYVNMLVGDRASGLGGAYTALSDDPSGCFYNPSGIAFSSHDSFSASVNAFHSYTKIYRNAMIDSEGKDIDWTQESSSLLPNFFGVVKKVGPHSIGVSYAVTEAIQKRQKQTFDNILSIAPSNPITQFSLNINDSDRSYLFGPSYAYRLSDSLSVGTTLYIYYRYSEIIRSYLLRFEQGEHYFNNYYRTQEDWGYRPVIGAIYEPLDRLSVGLSVSKQFVMASDRNITEITRDTTNDIIDFSDTNTILFSSVNSHDRDEFPYTVSLGIAYFYSPRLLFSIDMRGYESVDGYESIANFSFGGEYYVTQSVALRGGVYTDYANTPHLSDSKSNQDEHVDIYGSSFSISFFRNQSNITLGVNYARGFGDAQVVDRSTVVQGVDIYQYSFYLSAGYRF